MSEMKARLEALKKAKEGATAPKPESKPDAKLEAVSSAQFNPEQKAAVQMAASEKPKKKVECQFCGEEFSESSIKKHEKSCKENPENAIKAVDSYSKAEVDEIVKKAVNDAIVNNVEDQMASVYKKMAPVDDIAGIKAEIESMKAEIAASSLHANQESVENVTLKSDVASMVDAWNALKAPALKRWKACPGYKKLIDVFDASITRIAGKVKPE